MCTMTIRSIIFDWSGVISDDLQRTYEVVMQVFRDFGKPPITLEEFRRDFEIPPVNLYRKYGIQADFATVIQPLYERYWNRPGEPEFIPPAYSDAVEVLHWLA